MMGQKQSRGRRITTSYISFKKGMEVQVFDGKTVVDVFSITHEREIHRYLNHKKWHYVLETPEFRGLPKDEKNEYELVKDCYLPDFYVKGYIYTRYIVSRVPLPPSYQDVKNEK